MNLVIVSCLEVVNHAMELKRYIRNNCPRYENTYVIPLGEEVQPHADLGVVDMVLLYDCGLDGDETPPYQVNVLDNKEYIDDFYTSVGSICDVMESSVAVVSVYEIYKKFLSLGAIKTLVPNSVVAKLLAEMPYLSHENNLLKFNNVTFEFSAGFVKRDDHYVMAPYDINSEFRWFEKWGEYINVTIDPRRTEMLTIVPDSGAVNVNLIEELCIEDSFCMPESWIARQMKGKGPVTPVDVGRLHRKWVKELSELSPRFDCMLEKIYNMRPNAETAVYVDIKTFFETGQVVVYMSTDTADVYEMKDLGYLTEIFPDSLLSYTPQS